MADTFDEKGRKTKTIPERIRLAKIPDDLEIERDILEARNNKKARQDAAEDMLLDEIFNTKNKKRGRP